MSGILQFGLFLASLLTFLCVLVNVVKNKINIHYAMAWIIWGLGTIAISIFPQIIYFATDLLGIQMPVNTVFLIMIFLLYCMLFYAYLKLSKHNENIIDLNYEIAILKKKIEKMEKEGHHEE